MKKYFILAACIFTMQSNHAQNLIFNGDFELYTGNCPSTSPNGMFTQVTGWKPPNVNPIYGVPHAELYCNGTPNYGLCIPGPVPNVGTNGPGYVGFHTRSLIDLYNECIYQQLAQPLVAGNTYTVSFDLMTCQSGLFTNGSSDFCIYTNADTIIPGCPTDNPTVVQVGCIPYDSISTSLWKHHAFSFTATPNSNIVVFSGGTCYTTDIYYYLDNVSLTLGTLGVKDIAQPFTQGFTANPFSFNTTFVFKYKPLFNYSLQIFDCTGRLVKEINNLSSGRVEINRNGLSSGVYMYRLLQSGTPTATGKVMVQ